MKLKKLHIEGFRNINKIDLDLNPNVNVLLGQNAQGKTNILESIFLLVLTKSFRTNDINNLIKWENDFAKIDALKVNEQNNDEENLEIIIAKQNDSNKKQTKINAVKVKFVDFISHLTAVIFEPGDLNLIILEPTLRRRYMDILNSEICGEYLVALAKYNKIIKIRNKLLGNIRDNLSVIDELTFWDEKMLDYGSFLIVKRKEMIDFYNQNLNEIFTKIADKKTNLKIRYESRIKSIDQEDIRKELRELLEISKLEDINYARTSFGPHRDDISFFIDDKDIREFGSRGEFRSLILALKICELLYVENVTSEKPILLLDDVFSELDSNRRKYLLEVIKNYQTIITTTDKSHIKDLDKTKMSLFEIVAGDINN